jgi:hypothetical protein
MHHMYSYNMHKKQEKAATSIKSNVWGVTHTYGVRTNNAHDGKDCEACNTRRALAKLVAGLRHLREVRERDLLIPGPTCQLKSPEDMPSH